MPPVGLNLAPLATVSVPLLVIVPAEGVKTALVPILKAVLTVKEPAVVTVALLAIVRVANVRVPELVMEAPLFNVTVPLGERVTPVST